MLRDQARHGYDIAREVERRSDQSLSFNHGTLYPILHSLEKQGLVASTWERPDGERKRRVYALTELGTAEADRSIQQWDEFANAINKVIRRGNGENPA